MGEPVPLLRCWPVPRQLVVHMHLVVLDAVVRVAAEGRATGGMLLVARLGVTPEGKPELAAGHGRVGSRHASGALEGKGQSRAAHAWAEGQGAQRDGLVDARVHSSLG